jgi:hypothetical protein
LRRDPHVLEIQMEEMEAQKKVAFLRKYCEDLTLFLKGASQWRGSKSCAG